MSSPYYIVPLIEEYKSLDPSSAQAKKLRLRIEANIGDTAVIQRILGVKPEKEAGKKKTKSNMDTIDSFLDKFGGNISAAEYIPEPPPSIPQSTMPHPTMPSSKIPSQEEADGLKKLMKNHQYQEALKLIEAQNLINPQKSIYFAHQIRFLKKLIAIENFKTNG